MDSNIASVCSSPASSICTIQPKYAHYLWATSFKAPLIFLLFYPAEGDWLSDVTDPTSSALTLTGMLGTILVSLQSLLREALRGSQKPVPHSQMPPGYAPGVNREAYIRPP